MNRIDAMNADSTVAPAKGPVPFRVTILYENPSAGHQAMRVLDFLRAELSDVREIHISLWRLNLLESLDVESFTARKIANSDLIIVSASLAESCPKRRHRLAPGSIGSISGKFGGLSNGRGLGQLACLPLLSRLIGNAAPVGRSPEILALDPGERLLCEFSLSDSPERVCQTKITNPYREGEWRFETCS